MRDPILYTVYRPSKEFPRSFVVRRWRIKGPDPVLIDKGLPLIIAPTAEDARKAIPPGRVRIERDESDDPAVLESWI